MNPFELQAQFAQQWLALARTVAETTVNTLASMTGQATATWGRSMSFPGALTASNPVFPFPWMASSPPPAFAPFQFGAPMVPAFWQTNPFAPNPFASWLAAWSQATPGLPSPTWGPQLASLWTLPWSFAPAAGVPWTTPVSSRSPAADLIDQIATNYRTASGYAVAAVIGPFGAALDPRKFGTPWWQALGGPRKLN